LFAQTIVPGLAEEQHLCPDMSSHRQLLEQGKDYLRSNPGRHPLGMHLRFPSDLMFVPDRPHYLDFDAQSAKSNEEYWWLGTTPKAKREVEDLVQKSVEIALKSRSDQPIVMLFLVTENKDLAALRTLPTFRTPLVKAREQLRKSLASTTEDWQVREGATALAIIDWALGDLTSARRSFDLALRKLPTLSVTWIWLTRAYAVFIAQNYPAEFSEAIPKLNASHLNGVLTHLVLFGYVPQTVVVVKQLLQTNSMTEFEAAVSVAPLLTPKTAEQFAFLKPALFNKNTYEKVQQSDDLLLLARALQKNGLHSWTAGILIAASEGTTSLKVKRDVVIPLAHALAKERRVIEAETRLRRAIDLDGLGLVDDDTQASNIAVLADLLEKSATGNSEEVVALRKRVSTLRENFTEKARKLQCLKVAEELNETASKIEQRGQHKLAATMYKRVAEIRELNLGNEPETASAFADVARIYYSAKDIPQAKINYEKALKIYSSNPKFASPEYASALEQYAELLDKTGNAAGSQAAYRQAVVIRKASY
jgi:tetratricopeptide (TPR) repeat protein